MEHQFSITYSATRDHQPFDEQIHVMAQTDLGAFEEEGLPDRIGGKLLEDVPDQLFKKVSAGEDVFVELGGKTYRFTELSNGGTFELRRDLGLEST